ncbi:MAG TPA: hypothetical protein VEL28_14825 [Candidatus Binatia bacterium]|nr:hypothetical protein [Candidatus Binatia bacterium]
MLADYAWEIHDLLVAKAIAGRPKDLEFLRQAAVHALASKAVLLDRLKSVDIDEPAHKAAAARIESCFRSAVQGD